MTGESRAETLSGADGIISITFNNDGVEKYKSIIFQAKKEGNKKHLERQNVKMNELLPGGNMFII